MQNFEPAIGYVAPDGTLTAKGRALNDTSQRYVLACFEELRAGLPRPPRDSVPAVPEVPENTVPGSRPIHGNGNRNESTPAPAWMEAMMATQEMDTEWLLDGVLPMGGLSLLTAAPKVGKTTLARCLALAVARGMTFLGRATAKGTVLVVSLEDSPRKIRAHMGEIGAASDDPIGWYGHGDFPAKTGARLDTLDAVIREYEPVLMIVDPLFKFVAIRDSDAYAEVSAALNPLMQIARRTGVHILLTHHNRKGGGEGGEEVLGSTALFGGVDTLISLRRDGPSRTIQTIQRDGDDMPETVLHMDASGWIDVGGVRAEVKAREIDEQVLAVIGAAGEPMAVAAIVEQTDRRKALVLAALRRLYERGLVSREGTGRRGDPYFYSVPPQ